MTTRGAIVMDGSGWKGFAEKVEKDFCTTFAAEMTFWPLFQSFNFTRIPLEHQLLAVNVATIFDASFLSWARTQDDWVGTMMKYLPNQASSTAAILPTAAAAAPSEAKEKKERKGNRRSKGSASEKNER